MKFIFLFLIAVSVLITANAQDKKRATLPNVEDIAKVTISKSSPKYYTPESLLKILPQLLLRADKTRNPQEKYQSGTFKMKDGSRIEWIAGDNKSLYIAITTELKYFAVPTAAEIDDYLTLPNVEEVEEISISSTDGNWFTSDSLLKALPKFVVGGGYKTKMLWQQGTIRLKNGKVLNWRANTKRSLMLYVQGGSKYFQLPKEVEIDEPLTLPKPYEVEKIEISNTSAIDWYRPEELLRLLPEFVAIEGTYVSKQPFQYGTFMLKNGKKLKWMAGGKDSILLYEGSREQLFKIPRLEIE